MEMDEKLGTSEDAPKMRGRQSRSTTHDEAGERERGERGYEERNVHANRVFSDDERVEMFRDSLQQSVLPDLPYMPGYHVCWLTTSNPRDSIQYRMRLGYELIRLDDMPGWEGVSLKSGDYTGCVGINEMVAARIPLTLYNRFMREVHHTLPLAEEDKLKAKTQLLKQQAAEFGSMVEEGDGMAELGVRVRPMADLEA